MLPFPALSGFPLPSSTSAGASWSLAAARRHCHALAVGRFGWLAVRLGALRPACREALEAIHAFAAQGDDFVDEEPFEGQRERLLLGLAEELRACFEGRPRGPVFVALAASAGAFGLGREPFEALLRGWLRDCRAPRFADFGALRAHLAEAALPLGRLLLEVLGERDPGRVERVDELCAALQLTRYWQNLSLDVRRGRLYLPLEDLDLHGIRPRSLVHGLASSGLAPLLRQQVLRTRELYRGAHPLLTWGGWAAWVAAPAWLGGRSALRLVRETGERLLSRRPRLDGPALARVLVRASLDRLRGRAA